MKKITCHLFIECYLGAERQTKQKAVISSLSSAPGRGRDCRGTAPLLIALEKQQRENHSPWKPRRDTSRLDGLRDIT